MKRPFHPLKGNTVRIYTCGPSVYSYSHIGNFRTYLFEDVLVRYLLLLGYRVKRVMNITDVEDKGVMTAKKENLSLGALQKDKIRAFLADYDRLGMLRPDIIARASDHVPQMIRLIERICRNGYCLRKGNDICFNVRKFRRYGRLARLEQRTYFPGTPEDEDYVKRGLWDFVLWKGWTRGDGSARWHSPFGDGRPGWHIECSAISRQYLGMAFDIHCGGVDNIYPHHENEIAQSYAATGKMPAAFWLHAKHLTINRRKMSKSTGNVLYVRQMLKGNLHSRCLRFYLIRGRYRSRMDFSWKEFRKRTCGCEQARRILAMLRTIAGKQPAGDGKRGRKMALRLLGGFQDAMDDDLNTKLAFRRIFAIFRGLEQLLKARKLKAKDAKAVLGAMERINGVLGVF
jgi:cysteinyl-tRNA synthetase